MATAVSNPHAALPETQPNMLLLVWEKKLCARTVSITRGLKTYQSQGRLKQEDKLLLAREA
jgi:hypothetical protein